MTKLLDVLKITSSRLPYEAQEEFLQDEDRAFSGVLEACIKLGIDAKFVDVQEEVFNEETGLMETVTFKYCSEDLTLSQQYLSALFSYRIYLEQLREMFTQDAINFNTITFAIKGLEKRPESIGNALYMVNRYIKDEIDMINGVGRVIGTARAYGG